MAGLFNDEELKKRFTPAEIAATAEWILGPHGYADGSDQWLLWEAIRNLALTIKGVVDGDP